MTRMVTIRAATVETSEELLERAKTELGAWGGMGHTTTRNDDLEAQIEFDPHKADGGPAAVLAWCETLGVEFTAEFSAWADS